MTSIYGMVSAITIDTGRRKPYGEIIGERAVRRDRTLGNAHRSIVDLIAILAKAVPVKAR